MLINIDENWFETLEEIEKLDRTPQANKVHPDFKVSSYLLLHQIAKLYRKAKEQEKKDEQ